jgi:hypothetical protein
MATSLREMEAARSYVTTPMVGSRAMRSVALLIALAFLAGCGRHENPTEKPLSVKGEKVYTMRGTLLGRDAAGNTLKIDHQAVPGYMEAMTMDYPVRGANVAALPPDRAAITARLHVTDDNYWITDVQKAAAK